MCRTGERFASGDSEQPRIKRIGYHGQASGAQNAPASGIIGTDDMKAVVERAARGTRVSERHAPRAEQLTGGLE